MVIAFFFRLAPPQQLHHSLSLSIGFCNYVADYVSAADPQITIPVHKQALIQQCCEVLLGSIGNTSTSVLRRTTRFKRSLTEQ